MKNYTDLSYQEKKEFTNLLTNWLHIYTSEVINKVLEKAEEIYNNEFTMNMLKELKIREERELESLSSDIDMIIQYKNKVQLHLNCLTHSKSYRDVLYDMYIRNSKEEK